MSIHQVRPPTIKGISVFDLPARGVAGRYYQDGEGLDSNPYPKDSKQYEEFMMEMARLQDQEMRLLRQQINNGF